MEEVLVKMLWTFFTLITLVQGSPCNVALKSLLEEETCAKEAYILDNALTESLFEAFPLTNMKRYANSEVSECKVVISKLESHKDINDNVKDDIGYLRLYFLANQSVMDKDSMTAMRVKRPAFILIPQDNDTCIFYKHCPHGEQDDLLLANIWSNKNGTWLNNNPDKTICTNPLKGRHLKASAYGLPPFILPSEPGNPVQGMDPTILNIISQKLGFTYEIEKNKVWGAPIGETGYWSGVIGDVLNNTCDIGIGHIILQYNRYSVIDYFHVLYDLDFYLQAAKPKALPGTFNFTKPFTLVVWICLFISFVFVILFFVLWFWWTKEEEDLGEVAWGVYAAMFQSHDFTSTQRQHSKSSTLFLFACWYLFILAVTLSYGCNLRAYLMQVELEKPIDDEYDIIEMKRDLYLPYGTPFIGMFATSPIPIQQRVYERALRRQTFFYFDEGKMPIDLEKKVIQNGDVVLVAETFGLGSFKGLEERFGYVPYRLGKKTIFPFYAGFIVNKNTYWKPEFDGVISHLFDSGIIDFLKFNFIPRKYFEAQKPDTTPVSFKIEHILGPLILLAIGNGLGIMAVIGEVIHEKVSTLHMRQSRRPEETFKQTQDTEF